MIKGAPPSAKPAFRDVCRKQECINAMNHTCDKVKACGHPCYGFRDEAICLPCLHPDCADQNEDLKGANAEEYCSICYVEGLGAKPAVRLDCKHIFHVDCVMEKIKKRWPGPRIVFGFLDCSSCKARIRAGYHPGLTEELMKSESIEVDIKKKSLERGKFEGLDKEKRVLDPNDRYYKKFPQFA